MAATKRNFILSSGIGISADNIYTISSTNSTSIGSGAVIVAGGVGIGQSASIGGRLQMFNGANYTSFVSSASGNTVYTLPATSPATGSSVLQSTSAGVLSWVPMTVTGGSAGGAGTVYDGSLNSIPYYPTAGTAITGSSNFTNTGTSINVGYTTAATNSSSGALTVVGGVGIGGSLYVAGDLTINGTTTTINSVTLTVDDKNIELGSVVTPSDVTAEGGGITLRGATDKSINWYSGVGWSSSENFNLAAGSTYKINNTTVLSNSSLGTGVTNSSLTALGTITTGVWSGTSITAYYGGTGLQTTFTVGDLLYANTASTWNRLSPGTNGFILVSAGTANTPAYTNPATLTIGTATTATNVNVVLAGSNTNHPLLFTPTSGSASGVAVSSNTTLVYNPSTDILSVSGAAITNTTASTSTTSGALNVTGGVGIGQSISVGGRLQMFNGANFTAFVSSASGNTVYTLPATSPGTGSSVLQSTSAGVMSWVAMTAGSASGNTSQNVVINTAGNANVFHPILFTPSSLSAGSAVSSDSTISFNPSTEILNVSGLAITSGTASTNTTTGALVVRGGLGVTGQLSFSTASFGFTGITTNPTMSFIGATSSSPITLTVLTDNSLNFEGSQGSVFSIDSNLSTGEIFSVSDISGLPIISASAGQTVTFNEFGGYTQFGNGTINSSSTSTGSVVIAGGLGMTGNAFIGGTTNVSNTTASTTSTTGALTVSGGVGIGLSVSIGGRLQMFNGANFTSFVSSASGNTVYTLPATSPATGSSVLQSTSAGVMSWVPMAASSGAGSGTVAIPDAQYRLAYYAGTGASVSSLNLITAVGTGVTILGATNASSTTVAALSILGGLGVTGNAFIGGTASVTNTTVSTGTGSGALVVAGGAGIAGSLYTGTGFSSSISGVIFANGNASASTYNKLTITAPTSSSILTIVDGSTLITSGANSLTLTTTSSTNATFPSGTKTLVATDVSSLASLTTASSLNSVGIITSGTWAGTVITSLYGGTGFNSYAVGDLLVASTGTSLAKLAASSNSGYVLTSTGANSVPTWQAVPPAAATSVAVAPTDVNGQFSIIAVNSSSGAGLGLSTIASFVINPLTGLVTISGLAVTNGTNSSSTTTGTLTVYGGLGITGNAFIGGTTSVTSAVTSIGTNSGALVVTGGVGIGGSLFTGTSTADNISGVVLNNGVITSGSWSATAITTNYGGTGFQTYAVGDILYASTANSLGKLTVGTVNQFLSSNGSIPTWVSGTGLTVGTANQIPTAQTNIATTLYPLFANASTGAIGASIDTDIVYNAASNILTVPSVYSGTALSSPTFTSSASLAIKPGVDATTAIQLQKANGTNILVIDTTNSLVGINKTPATYALDVAGSANLSSTNAYNIAGVSVLNATTLGSNIVSSSLTSLGTITSGTWAGTVITSLYGGTGFNSYTIGDILVASTGTSLAKLSAGNSNFVLTSNGTGTVPTWQAVPPAAASSVAVIPTTLNQSFFITTVNTSSGSGLGLSTITTFVINPSTEIVSLSGLAVTSGLNASSTTSAAFTVLGGLGITGNAFIGGTASITSNQVSISPSSGALVVTGGVGIGGSLYTSTGSSSSVSGVILANGNVSASTYNKLTLTAPAANAIISIADTTTFATSGAYNLTLTTTATTNSTFPAGTKTLVPTDVTSLASLTTASSLNSIGTIATGVWAGTLITAYYGGTGYNTYTKGDVLVGAGNTFIRLGVGTDNFVLTASAASPAGVTWASPGAGSGTVAIPDAQYRLAYYAGTGASVSSINLITAVGTGVTILGATNASSTTVAALSILGGLGVTGNAFIGGTASITSSQVSISPSSGALVVTGGVGIGKTSYFGQSVFIQGATASTSSATGALTVAGGVGISGNLHVGTSFDDLYVNNFSLAGFAGSVAGEVKVSIRNTGDSPDSVSVLDFGNDSAPQLASFNLNSSTHNSGANHFSIYNSADIVYLSGTGKHAFDNQLTISGLGVSVYASTASISTTSGAFTVVGGVGIGGSIFGGSTISAADNIIIKSAKELRFNNTGNTFYTGFKAGANTSNATYTLPTAFPGTGSSVLQSDTSGTLTWVPMLASPGAGSGTVAIPDAQYRLAYYAGTGASVSSSNLITAVGTGVTMLGATNASSTTVAALSILGGLGVTGNAFIGGTASVTSSQVSISSSSGALVVTGGVGIGGSLYTSAGSTSSVSGVLLQNGNVAASTYNKVTISTPNSSATLTLADNSTLTTVGTFGLTLTTTAASSVTLPTAGILTTQGNKLSVFASTTAAELLGVISGVTGTGNLVFATSPAFVTPVLGTPTSGNLASCTGYPIASVANLGANVATFLADPTSAKLLDAVTGETGTGGLVFATSPVLVTPTLGVALATSINKVAFTAPASSATLTLANTSSLITSGGHSLTLTTTAASNVTFPTTGTLATTSNKLSDFAATTSSELLNTITGEVGSGALVFATSPDFTTSVATVSATFGVFNTTATTINAFGAATVMSIGAATGKATFNSTDDSSSTTTGGLVVSGGAGIAKSVSIGGRLQLFNGAYYTALVSSASGNTVYTLPATSPATGTSYLTSNSSGVMAWTAPNKSNYVLSFGAGFTPTADSADSVSINIPYAPDGTTKYYFVKRIEYRNETLSGGTGLSFYLQRHTSGDASWATTNTITAGSGTSFEVGLSVYSASFTTINSSAGVAGSVISGNYLRLFFTTVGSAANVSIAMTIEEQ